MDSRHPLFQRLINDEDFTRRICRDINPNYFATERGESILTFAIQHRISAECFDALIANGADINGGEKNLPYAFDSLLYRHYAFHQQDPLSFVQYNHLEPRVLHDAKIYLNGEVKTPLIQAILSGNFAYVNRLLQEQHISLANNPNNGFLHFIHEWRNASPLMLAAYLGQLDTVIALLAHGANINEVDEFGESAIFYALRGNQATVFYSLLEQAGINIALVNTIGQSLHDLMHQFNYPEIQQFFDPRERLDQLISNYPNLLSSILSEHIENRMPVIVMGLEREQVIPSLTRLRLEQQVQLAGFPLFQEAGGVLANEDYFQDTFITLSENHFQRPFITEGRRDSSYLVMGCHNGRYQIRHHPYSVSRAYHLLTLAHLLTHLNEFSAEVLLDFVSYLNLQDILDLFESPEVAMQILLNPEYVHAQQP
jgi:ankyrin repeat protein